jgi:hypothetical protein
VTPVVIRRDRAQVAPPAVNDLYTEGLATRFARITLSMTSNASGAVCGLDLSP